METINTRNTIINGDCISAMNDLAAESVDFILTDPPYITRYRDRIGRTVANDDNSRWLKPAFAGMHRVLKDGGVCVSFYGWNKIDLFMAAWREAGFRPIGHIVFRKRYASSVGVMRHHHESAFVLAKGRVENPSNPITDVLDWAYTGNRLHPTQKPVGVLTPLVETFTSPGDIVLDPFCGSGSTLVAASQAGRDYIGIELDARHHRTACQRLGAIGSPTRLAA